MRKRHLEHPFLVVDAKYKTQHIQHVRPEPHGLLYTPVRLSRHHLYPKDRTGKQGPYCHITLKIWCYKHFYGWNSLFQFFYKENGRMLHSKLTIDEIITGLIMRHPFLIEKVGSDPWRVLFGSKGIEDVIDLLCRMLSIKFNRPHMHIVHAKIDIAIPKRIAA